MALNPFNKIVLKSTTRISLNDRFSAYRQLADVTVGSIRQRLQLSRQTASMNRRLVQQFENRPSVIAALKIKKKSLRQRLGHMNAGNMDARFNLERGRTFLQGQSAMNFSRVRGRGRLRTVGGRQQYMSLSTLHGTSPLLKGRLGIPQNFSSFGQGARRRGGWDGNRRIGRSTRFRGGMRNFNGRGIIRDQSRGRWRSGRGGGRGRFSRGRGRFYGQRGAKQEVPSKQALDNELDEYMSRSKGNLDAELDIYMAQAQID